MKTFEDIYKLREAYEGSDPETCFFKILELVRAAKNGLYDGDDQEVLHQLEYIRNVANVGLSNCKHNN